MTALTKISGLAIVAAMACTAAQGRDLLLAPAAPSVHPAYYMYEKLAGYLDEESGGAITGTILGQEVIALPQMKDALQTGLANVGNALPLYFAADFPQTGIAGDLALLGRNSYVMGLAMTEFGVNCAPCQDEFKAFGGVYLGAGSSDVYVLVTTKPVRSLDDLKGMRLRSGGAPYSRWAENFGATPVNLPVGDTFEALSQGTIDGTMTSIVDMLSYRLVDVAKYVTNVPLGTYHVTSNFTFGNDAWNGLTLEEKEQVVRAANRADTQMTSRWGYQLPAEAMAAVEAAGIEIIEPGEEFLAASNGFASADVQRRAESDALSAEFASLVEKWTAIVEEVGEDPDALADRAWDEIWSKVDLGTYGQ